MISSDFATLPLKLDDFPKSGHNWHHPFPPELPDADAMLPTHPVTCNPTHCKGSQAEKGEKGMIHGNLGMGQNPIPLVNIKIAGKWMFIPLKMVCIGIDPWQFVAQICGNLGAGNWHPFVEICCPNLEKRSES